jgi:uncharacterized protein YndB with AHSA1/START domain
MTQIPPLTGTITVDAPIDKAFDIFVRSMNAWWPHQYHIGQAEVAEVVLEPKAGGRWYERGVDGTECDWGRVLAYEPPGRLLFTWQINGQWQFDPDPRHASEIEVRFTAEGTETLVNLEHRLLHRLEGGEVIHEAIRGGGSWAVLLESYAKVLVEQR